MSVVYTNDIEYIVYFLKKGNIIAIPTETVYAIGADSTNKDAINKVFLIKNRPYSNPLILHVSSIEMAERYVYTNYISKILMQSFWPGPLTIILPIKKLYNIHPLSIGGLKNIALRMPIGIISDIISMLNVPIVASSLNISGKLNLTNEILIKEEFGDKIPLIVNYKQDYIGIESTIIQIFDQELYIIRQGAISQKSIERKIGRYIKNIYHKNLIIPKLSNDNYITKNSIRLQVKEVFKNEGLLSFGKVRPHGYQNASIILNLSTTGNIKEACKNFFHYLYILDRENINCIAVESIPMHGIGYAINDKLIKASMNIGKK